MDNFEKKLTKMIFKAGTSNLIHLNENELKYYDKLTVKDYLEYGALAYNKKKELIVNKDFNSYTGEVVRVKPNFSFVHIEELDDDFYVSKEKLNGALIHDKVKVWLFPNDDRGIVEKILEHANKEIVGTLSYAKRVHVIPNDTSLISPTNSSINSFTSTTTISLGELINEFSFR